MTENNFLALLDFIADPVTIVDMKGKYLFLNSAYEKIIGCSQGEWVGKSFLELPNLPKASSR